MKIIVTHINPDLDAIGSVWLIKRFFLGWENAAVSFVPAGKTLNDQPADSNPDVLHVDTGLGQLDHHQINKITSATKLTWEYILKKRKGEKMGVIEEEAVERIVEVATEIDNARDLVWPEIRQDRFEFYLHKLIYGIKRNIPDDNQLVEQGLILLDGLMRSFKDKIAAEEKIAKEGIKFKTAWGQALAVESGNESVLWEGEVRGFVLVVKYDPEFPNRAKIYARFDSQVDLTSTFKKFKEVDPEADWYLHQSKKLLLISSDPKARGTSLDLNKIIEVLKS